MTTSDTTVLRDIRAAMRQAKPNSFKPADRARELYLEQFAEQRFATINEWRISAKDFRPEDIGKRCRGDFHRLDLFIFDHCIYFRGGGKCAAIVTQPYRSVPDVTEAAFALGNKLGLACHAAPHPTASIWNPGWTLFLVFTRPEHVMRWLPEQINGIQTMEVASS